jgi:hypothetical protein
MMLIRITVAAAALALGGSAIPASAQQPLENNVLNFGQCVSFFAFTEGGAAAGEVAPSSGPITEVIRAGKENDPPGQEAPQMSCTTLMGFFPPPPGGP